MNKLHTHYDNLKVARLAPQEVIRAAYKALSQKYHPDKNSGDAKAARIMSILNSAYAALSDPRRRREHDEWIAAEEWEIDWLLNTQEEQYARHELAASLRMPEPAAPALRCWKRWAGLAAGLAIGWLGGVLMPAQTVALPDWSMPQPASAATLPIARSDAAQAGLVPGVEVLAQALGPAEYCHASPLVAADGEAWPQESDPDLRLPADGGDALVRPYDSERRATVRQTALRVRDRLTLSQLTSGKYEMRHQAVNPAAFATSGCTSQGGL